MAQEIEAVKLTSENPLTSILRLDKDDVITYDRCKLCVSPFRAEAEELFTKGTTLEAVTRFLKEKGEEIPAIKVKIHFNLHYAQMEIQASIREYRDHLDIMMKRRNDMVDDTLRQIAIAWTEMAQVLAIPAGEDFSKHEKKAKTISMYQKTIQDSYAFLKSMHDGESKARAIEERFVKIWKQKPEDAKTTEDEKKVLIQTLKDFKEKLQQTEKP